MQAKHIVAHTHKVCSESYILQRGVLLVRECKVAVKQTAMFSSSDQFFFRQAGNPYLLRLVDDTLELIDGFHELHHLVLIGNFLGNEVSTAERRKVALLCHALFVGFGQEEVNAVVQVRTLIKVSLRCTGKETQSTLGEFTLIVLLDEPILLMYDTVIGQHLDSLVPSRVHRLVFGGGDGEEFGQFHTESHRDVGVLAHYAPLLNRKQRKLRFQGRYLTVVSHCV
ncbi:hypothetical protein IX324_002944 [Bacteroides pyogenes]|nr:hypothetical protein [Bacteroides pyogenes]